MNSIEEFKEKAKPEGYYKKLMAELNSVNKRLNAFNNINENLNSGFPFSAKDNICVKGVETTASSKILKGYIPPFNATVIERMLDAKLGFLGKTNMDEFGFGSFGLNSKLQASNPFDERYVAGGSSSGAAIATSILKYHVALAESTGGSIATPAAFCGVVGFTPTYGTISRYGLIDYANSLDKIGIMARHAEDVRYVFDKIKGSDKYDTTCTDNKIASENRKKILVIDQLVEDIDEKVRSSYEKLLSKLQNMGYKVEHKSVKIIDSAIPTYYIIAMAEASTNLAKYTGFKYGFKNENFYEPYNQFFTEARLNLGPEAKRRVVLGTFVRSASVKDKYYHKALLVRRALINVLDRILSEGLILTPVMPMQTPRIDETEKLTPLQVYKMDALTIPPNLCGYPHISFPCDYLNNMPIGAQLFTKHYNDYSLIEFVKDWEKEFSYKFKYNIGSL